MDSAYVFHGACPFGWCLCRSDYCVCSQPLATIVLPWRRAGFTNNQFTVLWVRTAFIYRLSPATRTNPNSATRSAFSDSSRKASTGSSSLSFSPTSSSTSRSPSSSIEPWEAASLLSSAAQFLSVRKATANVCFQSANRLKSSLAKLFLSRFAYDTVFPSVG